MKDKATAFKNEIAGSQTNKIVCKASSHEVAGPKKKHVDCEFRVHSLHCFPCTVHKMQYRDNLHFSYRLGVQYKLA